MICVLISRMGVAVNNKVVVWIIGMALVQGCLGTTNKRNPDLC